VKDAATTVLPGLDIFFQPSKWEAMSMVLLEAAVAGKAIVCTSVGEARNVITHERTGFIVAPGDIASMTQALATLVRDRELRDALGSAARQDVLRRFTADQMVLQYTDLYRGILGIEATGRN
jgi:glycosyltransferase involved in cell wall biosynthesis